jgi:hypothetical protein
MKIPPDLEDPNAPSGNPNLGSSLDPGLDPNMSLTGNKSGKTPLVIVGVLVVGAIGFFAWRAIQTQHEREMHAAVMKQFADIEKDEVVGKFWACLFGPGVDPGTFPNNIALTQRMEASFNVDPKSYPGRVQEECTPKAVDAKHKIEGLQAPEAYQDALKKYAKSLADLASGFDHWARIAPSHLAERMVGKKVGEDGSAWHSFAGGKPAADVIAYDRFLHCAVPEVDKLKDGQALVELLFKQCKDPKFLDRLQNECGKEVTAEGVTQVPSPGFKTALGKLQADDRELSAFDDCLRKGRKNKRSDDDSEVSKAWMDYMEAGREVRKIGKEALANK